MSMVDFINEFETFYKNIRKNEMELPTGLLGCRLLKSAEISEDKHQSARATLTSFSDECMKSELKAIYDNLSQEISSLLLKVEPVFESKGYRKDGYYSRGENNSFNRRKKVRGRKRNPLNSYGKISRCAMCQSMYHYARDYPHSDSNKSQENKGTLFTQEAQKCFLQNFLGETLILAVLDSGCTKTVCGEEWLKCYVDSLSEEEKQQKVLNLTQSLSLEMEKL